MQRTQRALIKNEEPAFTPLNQPRSPLNQRIYKTKSGQPRPLFSPLNQTFAWYN